MWMVNHELYTVSDLYTHILYIMIICLRYKNKTQDTEQG